MKLIQTTKTIAAAAAIPASLALFSSCGDTASDEAAIDAAGGGAALVEMSPEFPKPLFEGTPVPVKLDNLEPTGDPVKTFNAPEGSVNVAAGKTITSSDPAPIFGELLYVTDGEKAGSDGTYVELGPGKQWVQIDLEKEENIYAIVVWHFHKAAGAYHDVVVQVSNDPTFAESTTVYNNDHDNSSEFGVGEDLAYIETNHGRIIQTNGIAGQYVRLSSKGSTASEVNHYVEVEVYAAPSAEPADAAEAAAPAGE